MVLGMGGVDKLPNRPSYLHILAKIFSTKLLIDLTKRGTNGPPFLFVWGVGNVGLERFESTIYTRGTPI